MAPLPSGLSSDVMPHLDLPYDFMSSAEAQAYISEAHFIFCMIGVFACDAGVSLSEEWEVIKKKRVHLPVISHYVSRLATLLFIITSTTYMSTEVSRCDILQVFIGASFVVAITSTSFTFLLRVVAIFNNSKIVMAVFGLLWLSIAATSILVLTATTSGYIGSTRYCALIFYRLSGSPVWALASWTVFDTLSFIAVSWRLITTTTIPGEASRDSPWWKRAKSMITGDSLPNFTKSLLRGGERYFLSSLGFDILALVVIFGSTIKTTESTDFGLALVFCDLVLKNVLSCRLFRQTYLSVALVQRQKISLLNQDPLQIEHDIFLSDNLLKRGLGRSVSSSIDDLRIPEVALDARTI